MDFKKLLKIFEAGTNTSTNIPGINAPTPQINLANSNVNTDGSPRPPLNIVTPKTPKIKTSTGPKQGVVGTDLANISGGEFATRADRLNQAKVDAVLGTGYKAGRKNTNLALQRYYKQQQPNNQQNTPSSYAPTISDRASNVNVAGVKKADLRPDGSGAPPFDTQGFENLGSTNNTANSVDYTVDADPNAARVPFTPRNTTGYNPANVEYMYNNDGKPNPNYRSGEGDPAFVTMNDPNAKTPTRSFTPLEPKIIPPEDVGLPANIGNMNPKDAEREFNASRAGTGKELKAGQGFVGTGTNTTTMTGGGTPLQYDHSDAMMAWRKAHPMQSPPDNATAQKWYDKQQARKSKVKNEDADMSELRRLSGLPLNEKAVSISQQQTAAIELKKRKEGKKKTKSGMGSMSTSELEKFASTKHKGLPKHVTESIELIDESRETLKHIASRFKYETKMFMQSGHMDDDLYHALYDYYYEKGEMPYSVAKGDPQPWVEEHFYADMGSGMSESSHDLTELARLAGLSEDGPGSAMLNAPKKDTDSFMDKMKSAGKEIRRTIDRATLPAAMKVDYDRMEAEKDKAEKKKNLDECGDMDMNQRDSMNVSTNMSSDGTKNVTISAQGEKADDLLGMLKLAGLKHDHHEEEPVAIIATEDEEMLDESGLRLHHRIHSDDGVYMAKVYKDSEWNEYVVKFFKMGEKLPPQTWYHTDDIEDAVGTAHKEIEFMQSRENESLEEYVNEPNPKYHSIDSIIHQGNDLHRKKKQFSKRARLGDNPMAENTMSSELEEMLESILIRDDKDSSEIKKDPKTGRVSVTFPPPKKKDPSVQEIPLQNEPYHGPRSLKVDGEKTGTEKEVDEGLGDDLAYGAGRVAGSISKGASDIVNNFQRGMNVSKGSGDGVYRNATPNAPQSPPSPKLTTPPATELKPSKPTQMKVGPMGGPDKIGISDDPYRDRVNDPNWPVNPNRREGTVRDVTAAEAPYRDPVTKKIIYPPRGATNPPPDSEFPPGDPRNSRPLKQKGKK